MGRILSGQGQLRFATSGAAALQQMRLAVPDLLLLDAEMPGMTGYEVCQEMKSDPALADIPVIFVTAHSDPEFELKGLEAGAVDFIAKPISEPLLKARVKTQLRIKHLTDELRRIATVDALTDVSNRRSFDEILQREWRRGLRCGDPISLLMIDVDHFKLFNDCYGHLAGDDCLRATAQAIQTAVQRPSDLLARYGGEEFVLLLPGTPRAGAQHMARQILQLVEEQAIVHQTSPTSKHVSVSIGIGCYDACSACWAEPNGDSLFMATPGRKAVDLVECADKALYRAKAGGRAQAWLLDIDAFDVDQEAHAIGPVSSDESMLVAA